MPKFTIERQYLLPVYVEHDVEAADAISAMRKVTEEDDWDASEECVDAAGPAWIAGIWEAGKYGESIPIPPEFAEPPENYGPAAELIAALKLAREFVAMEADQRGAEDSAGPAPTAAQTLAAINAALAKVGGAPLSPA